MPRKAKPTISGAPPQPVGPVAGQNYGAGAQQMALQQAMPAPNERAQSMEPAPTAPAIGGTPASAPPPESEAERYMRMLDAAKAATPSTGLLTQPTARPDEPVTAGLPIGAGPGPEILQARTSTPAGDLLRRLSSATGDPSFAELARKAGA